MSQMNLLGLLRHFEEVLQDSFRVPMVGKVLLDPDEVAELLKKMKLALPEDIKEAERILAAREQFIMEAQEEARHIVKEAENYAQKLLSENRLMSEAEERAQQIVREAEKNAQKVENQANLYAEQVLAHIQDNLERAMKVIKKGREELLSHFEER